MRNSNVAQLLFFCAVFVLIIMLLLPGQSQQQEPDGPGVYTDSLGRKVEKPAARPLRIVSLSPGNTEILYAVGAGNRLVGVTSYCDYPPEVRHVAKVGGFIDPDLETIIMLQPDIVFAGGAFQRSIIDALVRAGIKVVAIDPQSLEEVLQAIRLISIMVDEQAAGEKLAAKLEGTLSEVHALTADKKRPRVFLEIWDGPLLSVGAKSYINDVINQAGGVNVAGDKEGDYVPIDDETLYVYNPDIYLIRSIGGRQHGSRVFNKAEFASIAAVRDKRIYYVDDDLLSRPGPRTFTALKQLAAILHPEITEQGRMQ